MFIKSCCLAHLTAFKGLPTHQAVADVPFILKIPRPPEVFLRCAKGEKRTKGKIFASVPFCFHIPKVQGSVGPHLSPDPSSLPSQLLPMNYKSHISLSFFYPSLAADRSRPYVHARTLGFLWVIHTYATALHPLPICISFVLTLCTPLSRCFFGASFLASPPESDTVEENFLAQT